MTGPGRRPSARRRSVLTATGVGVAVGVALSACTPAPAAPPPAPAAPSSSPLAPSPPATAPAALSVAPASEPPVASAAASAAPRQIPAPSSGSPTLRPPAQTAPPVAASDRSRAAASGPAARAPALPPPVQPEQGSRYWAVVLEVGTDPQEPQLTRAVQRLRSLGRPDAGVDELACLQGAQEALQLDPDTMYYAVAVLVADRAAVRRATAALDSPVAGSAQITAYCLD